MAISDPLMINAQGLTTLRFEENSYQKACLMLADLLKNYEIELFVLGYPKHMNGDISDSARRSENFRKRLMKHFEREVILWDERLSSVLVNKSMISLNLSRQKRKKIIDEMAAMAILQEYLDSKR